MHTLAFVNQKGGCGKTTSAINLAGALACGGERVLLVDLDPQAHATLGLGCAIEDEPTLYDVLTGRATVREARQRVAGKIDLLPATPALAEFEEAAAVEIRPEGALRVALDSVARSYDFAILDCPPRTEGALAANALRAADTAVLIIECGAFALQGALQAMRVLDEIATSMEPSFEMRVLATLFDRRTRFAKDVLIAIQARFGDLVFDTAIRTSVRLRETASAGVPVQVLDARSRAAGDFRSLAADVRAHVARLTRRRAPAPRDPAVPQAFPGASPQALPGERLARSR